MRIYKNAQGHVTSVVINKNPRDPGSYRSTWDRNGRETSRTYAEDPKHYGSWVEHYDSRNRPHERVVNQNPKNHRSFIYLYANDDCDYGSDIYGTTQVGKLYHRDPVHPMTWSHSPWFRVTVAVRRKLSLSVAEVARKSGLSDRTIRTLELNILENRNNSLSIGQMGKYLKALGYSMEHVLREINNPEIVTCIF